MKIMYLDWLCYCQEQTLETFQEFGHEVVLFSHPDYRLRSSDSFAEAFAKAIAETPVDMVFSYNFYPVMAQCCHDHNIRYVSFLYDNPFVMLYSYTIGYDTNTVFVFDSSIAAEFQAGGLTNVHYMILPTDPLQSEKLKRNGFNRTRLASDITFVGQLYNEEHNFLNKVMGQGDDYLDGYLEGIMAAQLEVQGYNFISDALTDDIIKRIYHFSPYEPCKSSVEPPKYVYTNYFVNRRITSIERCQLLAAIGKRFPERAKMFTWDANASIPGVQNMGVAGYENEMALVFNQSKINLNISLRSILSGIPLRCMDIMGNHGFLLSNYQQDLVDAFIPNQEFVYYEDQEDLLNKIDYYLSHDKERRDIAEAGYEKVASNYNYKAVFKRIFDIVDKQK